MIVLKVISLIYEALILLLFISFVRKTKDPSENLGYKVMSFLQAVALAYIIIN